uniref:Uncharacterized protein n=1 Tax=Accipiter nisus TaxID=211598 RepID=A0A8B9MEN5_9AVES
MLSSRWLVLSAGKDKARTSSLTGSLFPTFPLASRPAGAALFSSKAGTDARLSPCNKTPAPGRGLMEGARSSIPATSCRGKRLGCLHHQHPAPTICSASILESNGARRYTAPNLPTYRARQQISAKR